jgi:hypothetical protein
MRLIPALLVAGTVLAGLDSPAVAYCDPEGGPACTVDCLRRAHVVVDPKDPRATVVALFPNCPTR